MIKDDRARSYSGGWLAVRSVTRGLLYSLLVVSLVVGTLVVILPSKAQAQSRVTHDLQVLYEFRDGSGTTIADSSGVGTAMNLTIEETSFAWGSDADGDYLEFTGANRASIATDTKIRTACMASDELTLEAWIEPANTTQSGPARIMTFSTDERRGRNFTLSQEATEVNVYLKVSSSGYEQRQTTTDPVTANPMHIVFTRDSAGNALVYVDGSLEQTLSDISGNFDNWSSAHSFGIGNEFNSTPLTQRDWQGKFYLLAVYCDALTAGEVQQNYSAGTRDTPLAVDLVSFTADAQAESILLAWETATEIDTLGYNLLRANSIDGARIRINASLIAGQTLTGGPMGGRYQYQDETAVPGTTYHYWLETVDVYGQAVHCGGAEARMWGGTAGIYRVFLPSVRR